MIFYSDSVVIGIFLSAGAITYFAIAGSLVNYVRNVVSLLTDTFYPAATRMDAKQDFAGLRELLILGTRIAVLVALPLCLGLVFLGEQFIVLWMGPAYASSAVFLTVLIIPQITATSQYVSALILAGMAKHKVLAYLALAEGVVNIVLSIVLVRRIGLIGVAWGTAIPDIICTAIIVPWYTLHVLKMNFREYATKVFLRPVIAALPLAALGYVFSRSIQNPSWLVFGAEVVAMTGLFSVTSYFMCLTVGQRVSLRDRVWSVFHREAVSNEA